MQLDQILCQTYATLGDLARQERKVIFFFRKSLLEKKNSSLSSMPRAQNEFLLGSAKVSQWPPFVTIIPV